MFRRKMPEMVRDFSAVAVAATTAVDVVERNKCYILDEKRGISETIR